MRRVLTRPNTASLFRVLQIPPAATSEQYGIALTVSLGKMLRSDKVKADSNNKTFA